MDNETIIALTADIVSAHVSNNVLASDDVPALIQSVFAALSNVANPAPVVIEEPRPQPAVSIRSAVKPDAIACLDCGAKFKTLKRHLGIKHGMTPEAYKARWGLAADYQLVAHNYAAQRSEIAQKIGLGRRAGAGRGGASKTKTTRKPKAPKSPKPAE